MTEVPVELKTLIGKTLGVSPESVGPDSNFIRDLGADSLDVVELVVAVEQYYKLEISNEDAENMRTAGAICAYLNLKGNA